MWAVPTQPCDQSGKRRKRVTGQPDDTPCPPALVVDPVFCENRRKPCRLHRLCATPACQALPCALPIVCAIRVIKTFIAHLPRRARHYGAGAPQQRAGDSRRPARQSETKSDRRLSDSDLTGCVRLRQGATDGDGRYSALNQMACIGERMSHLTAKTKRDIGAALELKRQSASCNRGQYRPQR